MGYKVSPYVTHSARVPSGLGKGKNVKTKAIAHKRTENTEALSTESASAPAPIQHAVQTARRTDSPGNSAGTTTGLRLGTVQWNRKSRTTRPVIRERQELAFQRLREAWSADA